MTASLLDTLARLVAGGDGPGSSPTDADRLDRRSLLARGATTALAVSSLGRLAQAAEAAAATSDCATFPLRTCLAIAGAQHDRRADACLLNKGLDLFSLNQSVACFHDSQEKYRKAQQKCLDRCPRRKTTPKRPRKRGSPPPLPPNPYGDAADDCANCASVGGKCCYGAKAPGTAYLCACANPGISCSYYGCDN